MQKILINFMVGLICYLLGKVSQLLAIPPSYASALWAPAGVGVAAVMIYGPRSSLIGIFLAAALINLGYADSFTMITVQHFMSASAIGFAASLQAYVAYALTIRKHPTPHWFTAHQQIFAFVLRTGPISCLISATISVPILVTTGVMTGNTLLFDWFVWYTGDLLAVLFITPVILIIAMGLKGETTIKRVLTISLPLLGSTVLVCILFWGINRYEMEGIQHEFAERTAKVAEIINLNINKTLSAIHYARAFYEASANVDQTEFNTFMTQILAENPALIAIANVPRVKAEDVASFNQQISQHGQKIHNVNDTPNDKGDYFPIRNISPAIFNNLIGINLASIPSRRAAIERALTKNDIFVSEELELLNGLNIKSGNLILIPYNNHLGQEGIIITVLSVKTVLLHASKVSQLQGFDIIVTDVTDKGRSLAMAHFSNGELVPAERILTSALIQHKSNITFGNRIIDLQFIRPDSDLGVHNYWQSWIGLAGGLFLNSMLGVLLLIITGRELAIEQEVAVKTLALRKASRAKSEFLANMSHEIRTPLNGIGAISEGLLEEPDMPQKYRAHLQIIGESCATLTSVVNDILDFSKIEAGKLTLENSAFNLTDFVKNTITLLEKGVIRNNNKICVYDAEIQDLWIKSDSLRLRQVLINLISNANKFTQNGRIEVKFAKRDNELLISVRDNGIGIAKKNHSKIFLPFTQEDASTTRKYGGTGLGLPICKRICEINGGTIGFESEIGQGAYFYFTWPCEFFDPLTNNVTPLAKAQGGAIGIGRDFKILVAEDNPTNQKVIELVLRNLSLSAKIVSDGHAAVAEIRDNRYDLVFMDLHMPNLDGLAATRQIRAMKQIPQPFIAAMTASVLDEDRKACVDAGMNAFISKPISKDRIREILQSLEKVA